MSFLLSKKYLFLIILSVCFACKPKVIAVRDYDFYSNKFGYPIGSDLLLWEVVVDGNLQYKFDKDTFEFVFVPLNDFPRDTIVKENLRIGYSFSKNQISRFYWGIQLILKNDSCYRLDANPHFDYYFDRYICDCNHNIFSPYTVGKYYFNNDTLVLYGEKRDSFNIPNYSIKFIQKSIN